MRYDVLIVTDNLLCENIKATEKDVTVKGSGITGENVNLDAKENINIIAGTVSVKAIDVLDAITEDYKRLFGSASSTLQVHACIIL